jgi:hypothetical protein
MGVDGPVAAGTRWEFSFFTLVGDPLVRVPNLMSPSMIIGQLVKSRISIHLLEFYKCLPSSVLMEGLRSYTMPFMDVSNNFFPFFLSRNFFRVFFGCRTVNHITVNGNNLVTFGVMVFERWELGSLVFHEELS